jgi:hypothetical protein
MVARALSAKSMNIYQRLMAWFCFPLDVLWKHHMGGRYCNFVKLFLAGFVAYMWMFYIDIFFMVGNPTANPKTKTLIPEMEQAGIALTCFYGFLFIYGVLGIANLVEIRRRKKAGIKLHSYYLGVPRFLPDKPIVHTLVIPVVDFLIGLGVCQIIRPFGIYLCLAAVFQRWIFKSIFKQARTAEMDRQDRIALQEWKSGQHLTKPTGLVRVANNGLMPVAADESAFKERWKKVLKSSDSQNSTD